MSANPEQGYLEFAKTLAQEAGGIMRHYFRSSEQGLTWKADNTALTIADTTINQLVIDAVAQKFPRHSVLGEEQSALTDSDYVWVCDPIDGTFTFAHGIPISTFSLTLVHKGQPIVAVVYDPFLDRLFTAEKDKGAFMNDVRLQLSEDAPGKAAVSAEIWYGPTPAQPKYKEFKKACYEALDEAGYMETRYASGTYTGMLVAAGEFKGVIFGCKTTWDVAAIKLMVEEAGGIATDVFGNDQRYDQPVSGLIAASPHHYKKLLEIIKPLAEKYK